MAACELASLAVTRSASMHFALRAALQLRKTAVLPFCHSTHSQCYGCSERRCAITLLIVISTITVLLTVALLVGWTLVIVQNMSFTRAVSGSAWLLGGGIAFFVVIMSVLVLFSVFLCR